MEFPRTGVEEAGWSPDVVVQLVGSTVASVTPPPWCATSLFGIICVLPIVPVSVGIVEPIDVKHDCEVVLL